VGCGVDVENKFFGFRLRGKTGVERKIDKSIVELAALNGGKLPQELAVGVGTITLRDGRVVDVKNFRVDDETSKYLERQEIFKRDLQDLKQDDISRSYGLTLVELHSLYRYTQEFYIYVSQYFSPNVILGQNEIMQIEATLLAAISGLNKLPRYHGTVYFGACLSLKDFLPILRQGQLFWQNNFTSTSTEKLIATPFASFCNDGDGSMNFTIANSHSGADISGISRHPNEKEVLFSPAQPFRIKSITQGNSADNKDQIVPTYEIALEEVY
jgi:hypothetical protein